MTISAPNICSCFRKTSGCRKTHIEWCPQPIFVFTLMYDYTNPEYRFLVMPLPVSLITTLLKISPVASYSVYLVFSKFLPARWAVRNKSLNGNGAQVVCINKAHQNIASCCLSFALFLSLALSRISNYQVGELCISSSFGDGSCVCVFGVPVHQYWHI